MKAREKQDRKTMQIVTEWVRFSKSWQYHGHIYLSLLFTRNHFSTCKSIWNVNSCYHILYTENSTFRVFAKVFNTYRLIYYIKSLIEFSYWTFNWPLERGNQTNQSIFLIFFPFLHFFMNWSPSCLISLYFFSSSFWQYVSVLSNTKRWFFFDNLFSIST